MSDLYDTGKAIAQAEAEIISHLSTVVAHNRPSPSPRELIIELARDRDRDPFRAAITSLIASRVVEATPAWKLRLRTDPS